MAENRQKIENFILNVGGLDGLKIKNFLFPHAYILL